MIRIIVKTQDWGAVAYVGAETAESRFKTFDVDCPDLENYILAQNVSSHAAASIVGVEILTASLKPKED